MGKPDPFGIEILERVARESNPNHIGLHTTNGEAEEGFRGTQEAERLFIAMLTDLLGSDLQSVDGYLEGGGTTANMAGLLIGRNRTKELDAEGNAVKNPKNPTAVLCSHLTHYSIVQNACNIGIGEATEIGKSDGTGVYLLGTDEEGHLLLDQLEQRLHELIQEHQNVTNIIVVGNAGTTMLGSVDDIPGINGLMGKLKQQYPEKNFHFHVDAAHGGLLIPFYRHLPSIGFTNEHVDSITIDPHKMGGVAFGCGAILARKGYFDWLTSNCPYVPGGSCTVSGSRSGSVAVSAYANFRHRGKEGLEKFACNLQRLTGETRDKLLSLGLELFSSDLNVIAVKSKFPEQISRHFIVHKDPRLPVDLSNPNDPR
ncbi:MAG TPA: pyridoxal-dependent decarboxylase, partial [Candidatus Kryptobacter bacterium]|nr:pyridoxal-dependent decarboxylase [Candidatus Kryptobacter bacterium]